MAANFVKFQRGSQDAYGLLRDRNAVDLNTLYFLYDEQHPEEGGDLYLGYTLIGGVSAGGSTASALRDLSDVSFIGSLEGGMILQYSTIRQKWVNTSLSSALTSLYQDHPELLPTNSVTVETALADGETISDVLTDIVNPKEGDIAIIAGTPFVYDGTDWVSLTNSSVLDRISSLESQVALLQANLQAIRGEIDQKIAAANHLTYRKLNAGETLEDVDTTASDIDRTVFLVPSNGSDSSNHYYEYMYIDGAWEKIGSWETNLNGYITQTVFDTAVGNLQSQIDNLPNNFVTISKYNSEIGSSFTPILNVTEKSSTTVVQEIVDIHQRLKWNTISAS